MCAQKKTDTYKLMDSQKTRGYEVKGAQKTAEYENCEYETITGAPNPCVQPRKSKIRVHRSKLM